MSTAPSASLLDLDEILTEARRQAGLDDFGPDDFEEGLRILIETYNRAGYDEHGQHRNRARLLSLLIERLKIEEAFTEHPEIRDETIVAPVYLTGLPRTGTSALLNLLARNPTMRPIALWEGMSPSPLPGNPAKAQDPRYIAQVEFITALYEQNPDWGRIHHTSADTPEECIHLLNHTFADVQFGVECLMEPYGSWFQRQDHRASYVYYADLLRMLQWRRPGGGRFLLKSPAHLWALDVLVEMFPDCSIIVTHRDPVESVGSYASMMDSLMTGRVHERRDLGPVVLEYLARKVEHSLRCRETIDGARIIDVAYTDFVADGVGTTEQIHSHFGIEMTPGLERDLTEYAAAHPQAEHGTHDYDLDDYGLSAQMIRDRFGSYIDRFDDLVSG